MQPTSVNARRHFPSGRGMAVLTSCFLLVSVVVETAYSWRSLSDAYFLVKVVGWVLLLCGAMRIRVDNPLGLTLQAAGWGWMAANFWRAIADRLTRIGAGQSLRLGSVEIIFAGTCLAVCLIGLLLTFLKANRTYGRFIPLTAFPSNSK
jgi:hypothetical protein